MPFATQAQKDYTAAIHDYAAADVDLTHNLELAMRAYTVFYSLAAASSAVEAGSRSQMPTLDRAEASSSLISSAMYGQVNARLCSTAYSPSNFPQPCSTS